MEKTNDSRLIDFVRRRLRAERLKAYALDKVHSQKLSVKITLIYAATLLVVLSLTSLLTTAGVYISFYHQAQLAMESSIDGETPSRRSA